MSDVILIAVLNMVAELLKASAAGKEITWEDVDAAVARRKAAVANNAAGDPPPREG